MTPASCRVKHDPENGTYGDCIRACIATILELDTEQVEHFGWDDADGYTVIERVRKWLDPRDLTVFQVTYPGAVGIDDLMEFMGTVNPDAAFMLFGNTGTSEGDHVVVCQGGKLYHDPAWYHTPIIKPGAHGEWQVWVLARR